MRIGKAGNGLTIEREIAACRLCAGRFGQTKTGHSPRPVVWFKGQPKILIAGQAPGARVHQSGIPFDDPSGDRLRSWLGVSRNVFYDRTRIAIVPMAFCFPGYSANGSDLPPPKICASTWRSDVLQNLGAVPLTLLIGGYAQNWHLGGKASVSDRVAGWRDHAPRVFPLPHPSWRNTAWLRKNDWFEAQVLPALKTRVQEVLND